MPINTILLNKKDEYGDYPLYLSIRYNNAEIVQLLLEYANQHQIILELNEKNKNIKYPLLRAIDNNIKIVKLLIEYANKHQIILEYDENDIKDRPEIKNLLQKEIKVNK